ncbi:MAG: hypothetical protein MR670_08940 [Prevotella sp.]|nr:hypothetical protein [Prevotella sp.]
MKSLYKWLILIFIGTLLLFLNHYYFSYSRRIGNTRFYLVETMVDSKAGKPLAGLYYKPIATSGFCGENTPGFPKIIYWNDKFVISKNFDGNNHEIVEYVIINLDSIEPNYGEMNDIHRFRNEEEYYTYLKQIKLSEADMNQTDNHIAWWEILF